MPLKEGLYKLDNSRPKLQEQRLTVIVAIHKWRVRGLILVITLPNGVEIDSDLAHD